MSKRQKRHAGEDLWEWAERKNTALTQRLEEEAPDYTTAPAVSERQPGSISRVLSVLGLRSGRSGSAVH